MTLSSNATSLEELVDDIVTLILQRAAQQGSLCLTTGVRGAEVHDHTATELRALAEDVKNVELTRGK